MVPFERKFNADHFSYKKHGLEINILGITLPESNMNKLLLYSPFNTRHLAKYISTLKLFCNNAIFVPNSSLQCRESPKNKFQKKFFRESHF